MPVVIPDGLAPEVYPLAWLLGWWRGTGVLGYPGIDEQSFVQEIQFDHDGWPYLTYTATIWVPPGDADPAMVGDDELGAVWQTESGFWRVAPDGPADLDGGVRGVEVMIAEPSGHLSLYVGTVGKGRVELESDLIARTSTAAEVSAATRLYGLVQSELMWAWDMAAFDKPMQPYASARLRRRD